MDWPNPIESAKRIGGAIMHHPGDLALPKTSSSAVTDCPGVASAR